MRRSPDGVGGYRGRDTNGAEIAALARIGVPPGTIERIGAICVMGVLWKFI